MTAEQIRETMKEIRNKDVKVRFNYCTHQEFGKIETIDLGDMLCYTINEFDCNHNDDDITMVCNGKTYRFKTKNILAIKLIENFICIYAQNLNAMETNNKMLYAYYYKKENEDMKTRERYTFHTNYDYIDKALMINGRCKGFITDYKHCVDEINYGKIVCDIIEYEDIDSGCPLTVMIDTEVVKETKCGVMVYSIDTYDCKYKYDTEFAMLHYEF